jgi:hypothetical protein
MKRKTDRRLPSPSLRRMGTGPGPRGVGIGGRAASRNRAKIPHGHRDGAAADRVRHRAVEGRRDQPQSLRHHEPRDVVAWGGWGKTALVSVWADRLKAEAGRGAEAILAWSFYSQGTKERATSADRFLDWALKKLNLKDPGPSARLKADTIAEALKRRRVLLILDGVEPLQHGPGPQEGQLKDPAVRTAGL